MVLIISFGPGSCTEKVGAYAPQKYVGRAQDLGNYVTHNVMCLARARCTSITIRSQLYTGTFFCDIGIIILQVLNLAILPCE